MKAYLIENRQIRIFISSTFRDMQPERKYLVEKVFPALKKYCRDIDVTLVELDLRWGINEEESKQGKVAEICLKAIENTQPFFIGLLGERYGWIPLREEITVNTLAYPWIDQDLTEELSITEIEMQFGALRSKENINAYFYLRAPEMETLEEFKEKSGSKEAHKLERLKNSIRSQKKYSVQDYLSVEDLGIKVENDFKSLVNNLFPQGELSRLEKERLQQKAFLKSRTGVYIDEPDYYERINSFMASDVSALVITGESGMGKSALIANWIAINEQSFEGKLIYHFVGNTRMAGDYRIITQRLINEIRAIYGWEEKENEFEPFNNNPSVNSEKQKEELEKLLVSVADKGTLLIVLDGVNQLSEYENAKLLNWLPIFPENVKTIYSTLSEDVTMKVFYNRGYEQLELQPLTQVKREQLITDYLKFYGKSLLPEQVKRIAENKECKNTLVLRTLLEELRVFGVHEEVDTHINTYLEASDINSFFDRVLTRFEKSYNQNDCMVQELLSLISVSREGLSEDELLCMTETPPLYWSHFYHAFYNHFVTKNGLLSFGHQFLRDASWNKYIHNVAAKKEWSSKIIAFFEQPTEKSKRQYDELPYQFHQLQDFDKLHNFLLDFDVFDYIYEKDKYELGIYWKTLIETNKEKYRLRKYLELKAYDVVETKLARLYYNIGFFVFSLFYDSSLALEYVERSIEILERLYIEATIIDNKPDTSTNGNNLLKAYINRGVFYESIANYNKVIENCDKCIHLGEQLRIEGMLFSEGELAKAFTNRGVAFDHKKKYDKALLDKNKSIELWKRMKDEGVLDDEDENNLALAYMNRGITYSSLTKYEDAIADLTKSVEIWERRKNEGRVINESNLEKAYFIHNQISYDMKAEKQKECPAAEMKIVYGKSFAKGIINNRKKII